MTTYYLSPKSNYYIEEGKYFKNEEELKDDKDQPFTEVMFSSINTTIYRTDQQIMHNGNIGKKKIT